MRLTFPRLGDFRNELARRGYAPMQVSLMQKTRRRLKNRRYKQQERLRKRARYTGDAIQWAQWQCREAVLLDYMRRLVPPEIVDLIEDRLPRRPPAHKG